MTDLADSLSMHLPRCACQHTSPASEHGPRLDCLEIQSHVDVQHKLPVHQVVCHLVAHSIVLPDHCRHHLLVTVPKTAE
eukprot:3003553-Rhodomonas_salina.4